MDFDLEGLITVVLACISFFFIHDYPDTASFLTEEEWEYIKYSLKPDSNTDTDASLEDHTSSFFESELKEQGWKYAKQAFLDWQIYVQVLVYYVIVAPTYGIALFCPPSLSTLVAKAQLLSIPIYICASNL